MRIAIDILILITFGLLISIGVQASIIHLVPKLGPVGLLIALVGPISIGTIAIASFRKIRNR